MIRHVAAVVLFAFASLVACSSDDTTSSSTSSSGGSTSSGGSSSSTSSSGGSTSSTSSSSTSSSSSGGNACGYDQDCIASAAPAATFCASAKGTKPYQCCKPATPPATAGCTKATGGEIESIVTYCCTGTP